MIVKRFGCTVVYMKALYKCLILFIYFMLTIKHKLQLLCVVFILNQIDSIQPYSIYHKKVLYKQEEIRVVKHHTHYVHKM